VLVFERAAQHSTHQLVRVSILIKTNSNVMLVIPEGIEVETIFITENFARFT
jgi:hypothetical protein